MIDNKIDFIIIWVDGNDKEWQKEKNKYSPNAIDVDSRNIRYRDWDNLQYWFRGVEKFAPWVNKIHFVTWGHLPKWLNINNPKLNIVNHKDFIPEKYLPTFNANPIELNLYKIKNLSENFVFFNDDMFIIKPIKKKDFFRNGKPCDSAILSPIISYERDGFAKLIQNDMMIINTYFNKNQSIKRNFTKWFNLKYRTFLFRTLCLMPWKHFTGFYDTHLPSSYTKKMYNEIWQKENEILNNTCMCKFRDNNTNVNQWLIRYWQLASGEFTPRTIKIGKFFDIYKNKEEIIKTIIKQKYKMICINDNENINNFEEVKEEFKNAFEKILPEKSSYEI